MAKSKSRRSHSKTRSPDGVTTASSLDRDDAVGNDQGKAVTKNPPEAAPTIKAKQHQSPLTHQESFRADKPKNKTKTMLVSKSSPSRPGSKNAQKRARKEAQEDLEEEELTALLFGGGGGGGSTTERQHHEHDEDAEDVVADLGNHAIARTSGDVDEFSFQIDRTGDGGDEQEQQGEEEQQDVKNKAKNTGGDVHVYSEEEDDNDNSDADEGQEEAPAWQDPDDETTTKLVDASYRLKKLRRSRQETEALSTEELEQRLRQRYEQSTQATARTDWAKKSTSIPKQSKKLKRRLGDDDDDNDDDEDMATRLFSTSQSLLATGYGNRLPPNILGVVRCPDANLADPNKAVCRAVHFHPGSDPDQPLILTAGLDKTLRFFQVGEETSEKIHGIHFPKLPIYNASFLGNTGNVVVSGRRSFFYFYDAVAGKVDLVPSILGREERSWEKHCASPDGRLVAFVGNDGYVVLVDVHSKHSVGTLKLNGSVRAITFTPDGSQILASGSDGDVYRWDVHSRQCIERFANGDGTITSSLSASSTHLAVGAESGVVNLYSERQSSLLNDNYSYQAKTPLKSIMNLRTSADMVKFNTDGQILALSSQRETHGLKLMHVPSRTVFSNWPTSKTPLRYIWSMDFSPQSKFLAVGNDKGKCLLYKLTHYHNTGSDD